MAHPFSFRNARRVIDEADGGEFRVRHQYHEVESLYSVLKECGDVVSKETYVPASVKVALSNCEVARSNLEKIMSILSDAEMKACVKRWIARYALVKLQESGKRALDRFRESVLLLWDLTTSLRLDQQLVHMGAAMAQLMADWTTGDTADGARQETINDSEAIPAQPNHSTEALRKGPNIGAAFQELAKLIRSNFTRDITLVLDAGGDFNANRFKYIPARAKMDTGCDENLIRREILERAVSSSSVLDSLLSRVEQECKIEFEGVEKATFTPKYEITLTWYQDRQMTSRKEKFYVVIDAPFDVNIGSLRLARDFNSPALALFGRKKTREEKERELQNQEKQLKEAKRLEQEQILADQLQREQTQQPRIAAGARTIPEEGGSEMAATPDRHTDDTTAANRITSE
ncbi:MAG: hypothetical protein M1821_004266 [Bathelium mastoideum]|nr:MAG: hypothetical protein M1821_004266 [Bathelium mastoideum]